MPLPDWSDMDPVFEIRYVCNRKMLTEFYRKLGTGPRYLTVLLEIVFIIGIILYSNAVGIMEQMSGILKMITAIYLAVFFMPQYVTWRNLRGTKKMNDGIMPESRVVVGDTIEMFEGNVHVTIEYRKIARVVRLKHSYVLMLGKRNGLLIDPDGFTTGTFPEFKQFLREKRPDLKIPE